MEWQERKDIVQEIIDWLLTEADEGDVTDVHNHIWPPDDGQE